MRPRSSFPRKREQPWTQRGASGLPPKEANAVRRRVEWQELVDRARAAASLGDALADRDTFNHLAHLTARTAKSEPPFESASDRLVASAFRMLVEAWVARAPERRAAMVEAVLAGARLVDTQFHEERTRAARVWQHRSGGD